jgi:hypothetical protein
MTEVNKRKCKVCGEDKNRIFIGKYPNNKDKKWAGDAGKLWNGNICGECNVLASNQKMRKIRGKETL